MGRSPCCSKEEGLNRGPWTAQEDMILCEYIRIHGDGRWRNIPPKAGLNRCGKSCRLRWINYLRPDIKRGNISLDEEELIIRMHRLLGNRWSLIAGRLPGRTDNEIKNYWNSHLKKKLLPIQEFSKSPSLLPNGVIKSTPVRVTKAVKHTEMNPIAEDHPACISVANLGDTNPVETEVRNFTLADQQSPHCDQFAGNPATIAESLCDLKELLSPDCNLLSSASIFRTDFGLEEFYTGAETKECEGMCSDPSNMQYINSSTIADDQGRVEIYDTVHDVDWIRELDCIWN